MNYRRTIAISFVDHFLNELGERFTSHANIATLGLWKEVTGTFMYKASRRCSDVICPHQFH